MKRILLIMTCVMFTISTTFAQQANKKNQTVTTKFLVESMECDNCVKKIEKNIAFEKGVTDIKCDLATHTVNVTYRTDRTSENKLIAAFKKIDKPAIVIKEGEKPKSE